jgi:hypothetical protein
MFQREFWDFEVRTCRLLNVSVLPYVSERCALQSSRLSTCWSKSCVSRPIYIGVIMTWVPSLNVTCHVRELRNFWKNSTFEFVALLPEMVRSSQNWKSLNVTCWSRAHICSKVCHHNSILKFKFKLKIISEQINWLTYMIRYFSLYIIVSRAYFLCKISGS